MKFHTRIFAMILCVVLTLSAAPLGGFVGLDFSGLFDFRAEATSYSGTCGDNLTWMLDTSTGLLVISGSGAMTDWSSSSTVPWYSYLSVIKSVDIGNSVASIGSWAFYGCTCLTSVTIPDGVTTIGICAFYECDGLTSVTIPDSVTTINNGVFYNCDSLINIIVDANNKHYSSDSYGVLFNKDKTKLLQYPIGNTRKSYTIPDSVITISDYAFFCCATLTSVIIGNGVTTIGDYAFSGCDSLASVTIPDRVTTIGEEAFSNCSGFTSVIIGNGVTTIGDFAFSGCDSLASVTIPDSVTTIGYGAFRCCYGLTSATIPDSVTTIGGQAFSYCVSLTSITIPNNVTTISYALFSSCYSLASVTISDSVTTIGEEAFGYCRSLTNVTIGNSVTTIGDYSFYKCTSLTSVTIPISVTTIGELAFDHCDSLVDVYYCSTEEDWKKILDYSNANVEPLTSATIHFNYTPHNHTYAWLVVTAPTATQDGLKNKVCSVCGGVTESVVIPATGFEPTNGMVVDYANNTVYGLTPGVDSLAGYTDVVASDAEWVYTETSNGFGTGSKAVLKNGGEVISEYTVLIFGDVTGDGWYDAEDAFLVNMVACGMLDESAVGELFMIAADCNHDGIVNELDVELLSNASTKLDDISQSATQAELATNSVYLEYCSFVSQSIDIDAEQHEPDSVQPEPVPEDNAIYIFSYLFDLFEKIFAFLISIFS